MLTSIGFTSCLDIVEVNLGEGSPQLTVDAFITDNKNPEVILTLTQDFFDSAEPTYVSDATVTITEGDSIYQLAFEDNAYRYDGIIVSDENQDFKLNIDYDGDVYEALSTSQPFTPILDVCFLFVFEEGLFGCEGGYIAELRAYDIIGRTDYYWIRHYRNDTLVNNPENLTIAADAAFGGSGTDGFLFIPPIRTGINDFSRLYEEGEHLRVEIWSIEENTWQYLNEVVEQSSIGGPLAIVSPPTYNLRSNITHVSGDAEFPAIGMFSVSLVSQGEAIVQ